MKAFISKAGQTNNGYDPACVEAFECTTHVITSEEMNWYLVYQPDEKTSEQTLAKICAKAKLKVPPKRKEVFINYISPVHYNAIAALRSVAVVDEGGARA